MSTKAVHLAIVAALKTINGLGGFVNDLSATDRVTRTGRLNQEVVPSCTVFLDNIQEEHGPELGNYTETALFVLNGLALSTADTADAKIDAAQDLLDDVRKALRADRSLGGLVDDLRVTAGAFDGAELGYAAFGVVVMNLTVSWQEEG